jgi:hypothetical protein
MLPHAPSLNSSSSGLHAMQQPRATAAFSNPNPFSCSPDAHMCGECPVLLHPHASASSQPSMFTRASQSTLHPMSFGQATSVQRRMVAGGKIMDFAASQVSHGRGPFAQEPVPAPVSNRADFTAHSQHPHAFSGSCETVQEDGLLVCLLFFLHTHGFIPRDALSTSPLGSESSGGSEDIDSPLHNQD